MGARQKLNDGYVSGSLLLAAFAGAVSGSWLVFGVGLALLLGANVAVGNIRPGNRQSCAEWHSCWLIV